MIYQGITVNHPPDMPEEEVIAYVEEESILWHTKGKAIASIDITIEGDHVLIQAKEKSPIKRVRRISGYLSDRDNFNPAKQAELKARVAHI